MKKIVTYLYDEDENVLSSATTIVENADDIERHLEHWHHLKSALNKSELIEEEQALDAQEKITEEEAMRNLTGIDLQEPH